MNVKHTLVVAVAVVAAACNPPGYVKASSGDPIAVKSAVFVPQKDANGNFTSAEILMADQPGLCDALRGGRKPKQMAGVDLQLVRFTDTSVLAPDTGDYTIITQKPDRAGSFAVGAFVKTDSNCTDTLTTNDSALRTGIVTIDKMQSAKGGFVIGSFDGTFGAGDTVKGGFSAEYCELTTGNLNCQ